MHLISQVFSLLCSVIVVYNRELCVYFPGRLYCSFHVACVSIALQQVKAHKLFFAGAVARGWTADAQSRYIMPNPPG